MKGFIKKIFGNVQEPDPLTNFNSASNNNICSTSVCLHAIKGKHIEIRENTFVDQESEVYDYTYLGMNCVVTKAIIGRYCSIGNNVTIGPGEHNMNSISTSTFFVESPYDKLTLKECSIGNDVWIGVDSIIKRGVKIGNGAVIGANSVVTKDVPDYAVVVGNPAKLLRYRFSEEKIIEISASKWWDYDLEQAALIIKQLEISTG